MPDAIDVGMLFSSLAIEAEAYFKTIDSAIARNLALEDSINRAEAAAARQMSGGGGAEAAASRAEAQATANDRVAASAERATTATASLSAADRALTETSANTMSQMLETGASIEAVSAQMAQMGFTASDVAKAEAQLGISNEALVGQNSELAQSYELDVEMQAALLAGIREYLPNAEAEITVDAELAAALRAVGEAGDLAAEGVAARAAADRALAESEAMVTAAIAASGQVQMEWDARLAAGTVTSVEASAANGRLAASTAPVIDAFGVYSNELLQAEAAERSKIASNAQLTQSEGTLATVLSETGAGFAAEYGAEQTAAAGAERLAAAAGTATAAETEQAAASTRVITQSEAMAAGQASLTQQIIRSSESYATAIVELRQMGMSLEQATAAVNEFRAANGQAVVSEEEATAGAQAESGAMGGLVGSILPLVAAYAAFEAINLGSRLQTDTQNLANFAQIGLGPASAAMEGLNSSFGLGVNSAIDFMQALAPVVGILEQVNGRALDSATAQQEMATAQNLSIASSEHLDVATKALVETQRMFGLSSAQAGEAGAALYDSMIRDAQSLQQVEQAYGLVNAGLGELKPSLAEVKGLVDAAAASGSDSSRVLNELTRGFAALTSGSKQSSDALVAYHISLTDGNRQSVGFTQTLENVYNALTQMQPAERDHAAALLLGSTNGALAYASLQRYHQELVTGRIQVKGWADDSQAASDKFYTFGDLLERTWKKIQDGLAVAGKAFISFFYDAVIEPMITAEQALDGYLTAFARLPKVGEVFAEAARGLRSDIDVQNKALELARQNLAGVGEAASGAAPKLQQLGPPIEMANQAALGLTATTAELKKASQLDAEATAAQMEGHTGVAAALRVEAEAYRSHDLARQESAANAVIIARAQEQIENQRAGDLKKATDLDTQATIAQMKGLDNVASALRSEAEAYRAGDKASEDYWSNQAKVAEAQDALNAKLGREAVTAANQYEAAVTRDATALGKLAELSQQAQDELGKLSRAQDGASEAGRAGAEAAFEAWQTAHDKLVGLETQLSQTMDAEAQKRLRAAIDEASGEEQAARTGLDRTLAAVVAETAAEKAARQQTLSDERALNQEILAGVQALAERMPASLRTGLTQAESLWRNLQGQIITLDQQLTQELSAEDRHRLETKRAGLISEASDVKAAYADEAQAGKDMASAIAAADKAQKDLAKARREADYDDTIQKTREKLAAELSSIEQQKQSQIASLQTTAYVASANATVLEMQAAHESDYYKRQEILLQAALARQTVAIKEAEANRIEAIRNAEAAQTKILTDELIAQQKIELAAKIAISKAEADIELQKANIQIATAQVEIGLAQAILDAELKKDQAISDSAVGSANVQVSATIAESNAAEAAAGNISDSMGGAYQAVAQAGQTSARSQIDSLQAVANAAIASAGKQITSDNNVIQAAEGQMAAAAGAANGIQSQIAQAHTAAQNAIQQASQAGDSALQRLAADAGIATERLKEMGSAGAAAANQVGSAVSALTPLFGAGGGNLVQNPLAGGGGGGGGGGAGGGGGGTGPSANGAPIGQAEVGAVSYGTNGALWISTGGSWLPYSGGTDVWSELTFLSQRGVDLSRARYWNGSSFRPDTELGFGAPTSPAMATSMASPTVAAPVAPPPPSGTPANVTLQVGPHILANWVLSDLRAGDVVNLDLTQ